MSAQTIFNEIIMHEVQGVMFHNDMANLFDFLSLHGYKRQQEYRALSEFAEMRGVERYVINHLNNLPESVKTTRAPEIIPSNWYGQTRFNVGDNDRKAKVKELFTKWVEWERETKDLYQRKFKELTDMGHIACADKVNDLVIDVDSELKHAERQWLDLSAVNWDMCYICEIQDEIHSEYEHLTEDKICVKMC